MTKCTFEDDGERRVVTVEARRDGSVRVVEETSGALSDVVFDGPSHYELTLPAASAEACDRLCRKRWGLALDGVFASGDFVPLDLADLCDRADVAYESVFTPDPAASEPYLYFV